MTIDNDNDAAERAAHEKMMADTEKRRAEEAIIAAEQDAALAAVKAECDAYRAALKSNEE